MTGRLDVGQRSAGLWEVREGDCIEVMGALDACSVDAIVTDPPYGLGFMGKDWDSPGGLGDMPMRRNHATNMVNTGATRQGGRQRASADFLRRQARDARTYQEWCESWGREAERVLRPGGYMLAFGGTRTYHRLTVGLEDAGLEIRDMIEWLYGSGFPKHPSCLKPAHEPIVVARKAAPRSEPLNIDACRIGEGEGRDREGEASADTRYDDRGATDFAPTPGPRGGDAKGRWPANVILDEAAAGQLDAQSGVLVSGKPGTMRLGENTGAAYGAESRPPGTPMTGFGDVGGASRFFYCAKADRGERNAGCDDFDAKPLHWSSGDQNPGSFQSDGTDKSARNSHPTVKPVDLMCWLVRLVTPADGIVLDPFTGSGTTGCAAVQEGFRFLGIEREADYAQIARARIAHWEPQGWQMDLMGAA